MTVGAVVRGGLYLDGTVAYPGQIRSVQLATSIRKSKYFPELRLVMVHGLNKEISSGTIERVTGLPLIKVSRATSTQKKTGTLEEKEFGLLVETKVDPPTLRKILTLTQVFGPLPEPVRVAHLLAKLHIFGTLLQDKG
ncbi:hypothetical protein J2P12_00245 [Candidatus Bathyarchaeota archaeon]|nr:hypothetical protein [Candidatus Bathyarchaeota archaeon]